MTPVARLLLSLAVLGGLLAASELGAQTIWRCEDSTGTEVFTDRPQARKNCEIYQLHTQTLMLPKRRDAEVRLTVPATAGTEITIKAEPKREESVPTGLLSFSAVNRLSVGMTEAEVANIAGPPKTRNIDSWVYRSDDSVVELRFGSGRVVEIRQYPPGQ
jgi:hypothetical protein